MTLYGVKWRSLAFWIFLVAAGFALGTASTWGPIMDGPSVRDASECVEVDAEIGRLQVAVRRASARLDELERERFDCGDVVALVLGSAFAEGGEW